MNDQVAVAAPTESYAAFVSATTLDDLPEIVIERSKLAILDTIGVTLAATETRTAKAVRALARMSSAGPRSSVLGTDEKTDPAQAAFVNGTTGHALDYDDVSWAMIGHPTVAILPAVLAVAEDRGLTGAQALTAYAVGYEVAASLGQALNPSHYERGWHATGTLGTLGAVAAVSNLVGLTPDQAANALGVAASMASGLRQNFGTDTKPLHAGQGARNGVVAVELTEQGFTAAEEILDSQWGVRNVFSDASAEALNRLAAMGSPWAIAGDDLLIKTYPSCVSTHTGIDSTLRLRREHTLDPSQVESVDVGVVHLTTKILIHNRPTTGLEGKFSMPYCVSRALLDGAVRIADFTDSRVNERSAQALLRRVRMQVDERVSSIWRVGRPRGAIVNVRLAAGEELTVRTDIPSGTGENLTRESVIAKFEDCFGEWAGPAEGKQAGPLLETLMGLEAVSDLKERVLALM